MVEKPPLNLLMCVAICYPWPGFVLLQTCRGCDKEFQGVLFRAILGRQNFPSWNPSHGPYVVCVWNNQNDMITRPHSAASRSTCWWQYHSWNGIEFNSVRHCLRYRQWPMTDNHLAWRTNDQLVAGDRRWIPTNDNAITFQLLSALRLSPFLANETTCLGIIAHILWYWTSLLMACFWFTSKAISLCIANWVRLVLLFILNPD